MVEGKELEQEEQLDGEEIEEKETIGLTVHRTSLEIRYEEASNDTSTKSIALLI